MKGGGKWGLGTPLSTPSIILKQISAVHAINVELKTSKITLLIASIFPYLVLHHGAR